MPATDTEAAKAVLDAAGPLELTFLYSTGGGSGVAAAAELAVQQWEALGIKVTAKGQDDTALQGTIFGAGDWDIAWVPLNVNSPDQVVPFLSGPAAPDGTNFSAIENADYDAGVKKASAMTGAEGCDTWLRGRVGPVRRRGHRALRQQRGADLRRQGRVRDPGPARPDQHPDARGVTMTMASSAIAPSRSRPQVGGPRTGVRSHVWARFAVRRSGACWCRCGCW